MKKILGITAILMTAMFAASVLATETPTVTNSASVVQCIQNSDCYQTYNLCTKSPTDGYKACTGDGAAALTWGGQYWYLTTSGLNSLSGSSSTEWALIYYPDVAANNGAGGIVITTFTGDKSGLLINPPEIDLPIPTDNNYATGAKIWIVPKSDLTGGNSLPLTWVNFPTLYLMDKSLWITYNAESYSVCNANNVCELATRKLCGISASGVNFGPLLPGTSTSGSDYSKVSNSGNTASSLGISGTDWAGAGTMPVGATSWSVTGSTGAFTQLTIGIAPTGVPVPASGSTNVNLKLAVPAGQTPLGAYTQTMTFTGGC